MTLLPELVHHVLTFVACTKVSTSGQVRELYDKDELQAKDALLACSLVSHTWREFALPYLYSVVGIHLGFHQLSCASNHRTRVRRLTDFLGFLISFPHIPSCIRELRLSSPFARGGLCCDMRITQNVGLVVEIVARLPRLRVVFLQNLTLSGSEFMTGPDIRLPRSLDRLEYVLLPAAALRTRGDPLTALFSLFSDVQELQLHYLDFTVLAESARPCPPNFRFHSLILNGCSGLDHLVQKFRPTLVSTKVTTLELSRGNSSDASARKDLWCILSPSLVDVTLDLNHVIGRSASSPSFLECMELARCTHLTSVTIHDSVYFSGYERGWAALDLLRDPMNTWQRLVQTLSRLTECPILRRVTVRLSLFNTSLQPFGEVVGQCYDEIRAVEDAFLRLRMQKVNIAIVVLVEEPYWADRAMEIFSRFSLITEGIPV